jgi:hypothetical protein
MGNRRRNAARTKKNVSKVSNEAYCEIWETFKKYNSHFIVSSQNPTINLKGYIKKNEFLKLFVLPADYLYYWKEMINKNELDYLKFGQYIIEKIDKFRPISLEGFQNNYIIDKDRYPIDGKTFLIS